MGWHSQWRKVAKRERRRRIRIFQALKRKNEWDESEECKKWDEEQNRLELFEREEIERQNDIENEKWLKADSLAFAEWKQLQEKIELTRLRNLENEIKIQKEWENEQKRVSEVKAKLKELEEQTKKQHIIFMEKLELFLNGSVEPPPELLTCRQTKPDMESCPFFIKTACCRFGDDCSRNHKYPGITSTLLAPNFYTQFGLENSNVFEYEDVILEHEDSDTYKEYKDFFYDVLPEFEKYGEVIEFKVCHNYEKHLRGNTYVQFSELRCAVAAYRSLNARWYGGRQISLQFCDISSWKNAICGLQLSRRCPKGRACNFLHVFRNPRSLQNNNNHSHKPRRESERSWRWSESPEVEMRKYSKSRRRSKERERERKKEKRVRSPRSESRNRSNSPKSRRSRTPKHSKRRKSKR